MRPLFLRLLLLNSLFGCGLAALALWLDQPIPAPSLVSIVAVLALYCAGAAFLVLEAWRFPVVSARRLHDIEWGAERLPGVAMLGSLAGFVAEDSHDAVKLAVLTSTFVGVACWQALGVQHRMVSRELP